MCFGYLEPYICPVFEYYCFVSLCFSSLHPGLQSPAGVPRLERSLDSNQQEDRLWTVWGLHKCPGETRGAEGGGGGVLGQGKRGRGGRWKEEKRGRGKREKGGGRATGQDEGRREDGGKMGEGGVKARGGGMW